MRDRHTDTLDFAELRMADIGLVGGKNASLGEMFNTFRPHGVGVLDGFATTADAYRRFLDKSDLEGRLRTIFADLDVDDVGQLAERGRLARQAVLETPLPADFTEAVVDAYRRLCDRLLGEVDVAVRSSATAEDLPEASFAGAAETFLNIRGNDALLRAVHHCFSSLFTDRAINYRQKLGYDQLAVSLSAGVMPMVRSDKASSGVIFTLDPETGFRDVVVVTGAYGLGENVVKGIVNPDEWTVFKPTLSDGRRPLGASRRPIVGRRLGTKEIRMVYGDGTRTTRNEMTPPEDRQAFSLTDDEVITLAHWSVIVESHYSRLAGRLQPMDLEWAKDGLTGALFIVQARPETVHSRKEPSAAAEAYHFEETLPEPIVRGQAVGEKIASGRVRVVGDARELTAVQAGEVLVARNTDPDWGPVMRKVAAIVTDQGGRTAHAAIVSREFGLTCVVGTGDATSILRTGQEVTVSSAEGPEGHVYPGILKYRVDTIDASGLGDTRTAIMLNVGDPGRAFALSAIPNAGVGLARTEFIINNDIGIHPMALVRYPELSDPVAVEAVRERIGGEDPRTYFVRRFSEGVGRIAAAFYPKPVIVRTSDFKTNEYAQLIGGKEFEASEENPMLGFRGASRYYDPRYAEGFALECEALVHVRREMGLSNVKVMIPFCRTVAEGVRVIGEMAKHGLRQGEDGLEIYAMCEIPSNVVLAREFLEIFDGFSIGSNDLTQLVLGIDRDSGTVAHLFDERNDAVYWMIGRAIDAAREAGKPIGICGQAPSDYPEFAEWLVARGITSISLNPDTAIQTAMRVQQAEQAMAAGK